MMTLAERTADRSSHMAAAAESILAEIENLTREIDESEDHLAKLRAKKIKARQSFDGLLEMLSDDERNAIETKLAKPNVSAEELPKSGPAHEMLELIKSDRTKTWKVLEIQEHLKAQGQDVSEKYASNTLRRLYDIGIVRRIGRGQYRINEMILGCNGLDDERDFSE